MRGGRAAVFLDRDGTLNEEVDFLRSPGEIVLIPGSAAAVRAFNASGIFTCVISNQSGVARGFITEQDLIPIHAELERLLALEGAKLDRIYYCPHHPDAGNPPYNIACDCRKPGTGMLRRGERELGIDLERSVVVGDRLSDLRAGIAVGATTVLVLTGYGMRALRECEAEQVKPDFVSPSLAGAVEFIMHTLEGVQTKNA